MDCRENWDIDGELVEQCSVLTFFFLQVSTPHLFGRGPGSIGEG